MEKINKALETIEELKEINPDMYLFYVEDLIKNNGDIGEEVIEQIDIYSDLFDILSKELTKLSK